MTDDQLVDHFILAVYKTRGQKRGVAHVTNIMRHMGLEASSLPDFNNPTTDDDRRYTRGARLCEERGYIESLDDRYVWVRITDTGKQYVERSF